MNASVPQTLNLPDSNAPSLTITQATDAEKLGQWIKNSPEWRGALDPDAYLQREHHLANQPLTKDGGITWWVLVDSASNEESRVVLSGCETFRKKAVVARKGKVEDTTCHGIGSVFCPPEFRRRGYTARMMKELASKLETFQTEDGKERLFSILYSDVGKKFYSVHGWEPFTSSHIAIPPKSESEDDLQGLPKARPLYAEDLDELCKTDEQLIRESLETRSASDNIAVAIIPDVETIQWHHAREEFVGQHVYGKSPVIKGAIVGDKESGRVWCYWTRVWYNSNPKDYKGNILYVLRIVTEKEGELNWRGNVNEEKIAKYAPQIAAILRTAQYAAKEWNMEEVQIWNPAPVTLTAVQTLDPTAKVIDRDNESIASLYWYPPHEGNIAESIDWICNEKYGWN